MPNHEQILDAMQDLSVELGPTILEDSPDVLISCNHCNRMVDVDESVELRRGNYCEDCAPVCASCSNNFYLYSGATHAYIDGENYCRSCTMESFRSCESCSEWEYVDNMAIYSGSYWCDGCRERYLSYCEDCDEYYHYDEEHNHGSDLIHDYGYRPVPNFLSLPGEIDDAKTIRQDSNRIIRNYKQVAFLGFELEVECRGDRPSYMDGAHIMTEEVPYHNDVLYLKQDGSLNYGFEIVTHPMTLGWAMQNFPWERLNRLSDIGFAGWDASTAGLHIHVSRDGFRSESHQARFIHFIVQNSEFMQFLAGRESSRWASFDKEQLNNLRNKLRREAHADRYQAVNVQNKNTLEVRIFRSSLNPDRVKMCLQLVDAIVNYTENLEIRDFIIGDSFTYPAFASWVSGQTEYSILHDYLDRWLEPFSNNVRQIGE